MSPLQLDPGVSTPPLSPVSDARLNDAPPDAASAGARRWRWPALVAAAFVSVFGFLPIANWIPDGLSEPNYLLQLQEWASGSAVAIGVGVVLTILLRRVRLGTRMPVVWTARRYVQASVAIALAAFGVYALIARTVYNRHPVLIDEMVQVIQAQIYATGHLWRPSPAHPEFFSTLHVVNQDGRLYSQFPPGGPLMLTLGELLGATWLVGPFFGALSVLLFAFALWRFEERRGIAVGAVALFAFAPFAMFMSGSHMNHTTTMTWLLVALAGLSIGMTSAKPRPLAAFVTGLGLGVAATIRPVDALAFALPAALWLLLRATRDRRAIGEVLASGAGVAIPMLLMLWVNRETTGSPLLFGYQVLWGKGHDLGFHRAPWGPVHTPARGTEMVNLYLLGMQRYLYESPLPSLLPAVGALWLARRTTSVDRYLLASGGLVTALYFAYWHTGFFVGPRFLFPLIPLFALWTARFPAFVRDRLGDGFATRAVGWTLVASVAISVLFAIPQRGRQYATAFDLPAWDFEGAAEQAGVHDALIFVRESWESQLVVRMWALGISHPDGEQLYHTIDACRLEHAVTSLEQRGVTGRMALAELRPLTRDSLRVETQLVASGVYLRVSTGATYTPRCRDRLDQSAAGVIPLAPFMAARRGGNVYARELQARDTILIHAYPGRPLYFLHPVDGGRFAAPRFYPLDRDSMARAWALTVE